MTAVETWKHATLGSKTVVNDNGNLVDADFCSPVTAKELTDMGYKKVSQRGELVARVRRAVTLTLGRGARIHSYTVAELKAEVAKMLADSYYDGFIPDRKMLEDFVK